MSASKTIDVSFISDVKTTTQLYLDRFSIGLSVLCVFHCLAAPILLTVFPSILVTFHLDDHVFHALLLWLVIPLSAVAIFLGCKRHEDQIVFTLAGVGIALLSMTILFGHDVFGEVGEKTVTLLGASILAYAHWRNYTFCRKDSCKH